MEVQTVVINLTKGCALELNVNWPTFRSGKGLYTHYNVLKKLSPENSIKRISKE